MGKQPGLSEIHENARGFVGKAGIILDKTKSGRDRVRFDLCCGDTKPELNKYPIWRYCVGYGVELVGAIQGARRGSWLRVSGWLSGEGEWTNDDTPVENDGRLRIRETLVLYKAELLAVDQVERQLALINNG